MPNRSDYPKTSMHHEDCEFTCSLVGAGAANLTVTPATAVPADDNFASSGTRGSLGTYAIVYKEHFPRVLQVIPTLVQTTGPVKNVQIVSVVEATKTINIKVWSAQGNFGDGFASGTVASSDPAEIAAGAVGTVTLAVPGAAVGDAVFVHPQALATGLVMQSYIVTDTNEVTVTLFNPTASPIDDTAQTYEYLLAPATPADVQELVDLATTDTLKLTVRARKSLA